MMNFQREIERRYGSPCTFIGKDDIGRLDTGWQRSQLPASFEIQTYAFDKSIEEHPEVVGCYAWVGENGALIVMLQKGEVNSPETAIREYYARNSN